MVKLKRKCKLCKKIFYIETYRKKIAKYCSAKCKSIGDYSKAKKGGFGAVKGNIPWNKGVKTGIVPSTAFKKGDRPHNYSGGHYHCGYWMVALGDDKYQRRSRFVMEQHLGRKLRKTEIVHHIDGVKDNDIPSNLCITNRAKHNTSHHKGIKNPKKNPYLKKKGIL